MVYRILFVCLGNICRSPAAENIMNHLIEKAGVGDAIRCDSAGTSNYHIGDPPDPRMREVAFYRGLRMQGCARQFRPADFEDFDLILAMDRENYRDILNSDLEGRYQDKVRLICDYARHHNDRDVPDPYYGGRAGFDRVLDLLFDACESLLDEIVEQQQKNNS